MVVILPVRALSVASVSTPRPVFHAAVWLALAAELVLLALELPLMLPELALPQPVSSSAAASAGPKKA